MSWLSYIGIVLFTWFVLARDVKVSSERGLQKFAICISELRVYGLVIHCLFEYHGGCYA